MSALEAWNLGCWLVLTAGLTWGVVGMAIDATRGRRCRREHKEGDR